MTAADEDSSDLSSLSSLSPAPSDDESDIQLRQEKGILKFFHKVSPGSKSSAAATVRKETSPPPPKRERAPSPPHEYVLADNPDIAFIVMFRHRLADAFPKNLANFGPQELERDVADLVPGDRVEYFLCALLKLLLNRQSDVKFGHYHRALEEAVQSHKAQWPVAWKENPLADGKMFTSMTPTERLSMLRALILWAMSSSKVVHDLIDRVYKNKRNDDDSNIVMSVQPWGSDSDKRRYYLIEGRDDTAFRVYRESNPAGFINRTWWSVAGTIDEIRALIEKLETADGGPKARKLAKRLTDEIPRFEATEEKRRRREYRQLRRDQFKRPEPGFSLYEGRTRGKRIKYTYSDDEDFLTDSSFPRRSARHTPAELSGPVTTASGRQIRAPHRLHGNSNGNDTADTSAAASLQGDTDVDMLDEPSSVGPTGRPRRSAAVNHGMNGWAKTNKSKRADEEDEEEYDSQADEEEEESEPDLDDDNEDEDEHVPDEDEDEENDGDGLGSNDSEDNQDAMLDEEDKELVGAGGAGGPDDGGGSDDDNSKSAHSVIVKFPVSAVLDRETGKWSKSNKEEEAEEGEGQGQSKAQQSPKWPSTADEISVAAAEVKPLLLPSETQRQPHAATALVMDVDVNEGTEPAKEASDSEHVAALAGTLPEKAITAESKVAPARKLLGTMEKENSAPMRDNNGVQTSLACRGSPERAQAVPRPVDAVGYGN